MSTRTSAFTLVALALTLGLMSTGLLGCSTADEPAEEDVQAEETASVESTETAAEQSDSDHWMNGHWAVGFTLVSVEPDADWSRQAADQPSAEWDCVVDGDEMTISGGSVSYTGPFTQNADDTWHFDATDEFTDENGETWSSHLIVDITQVDGGTFAAEQWGEISSDVTGVLYEAVWTAEGTKTD